MSIRHGHKWRVVAADWCYYTMRVKTYRTLYGARMAARVWGGWVERIRWGAE